MSDVNKTSLAKAEQRATQIIKDAEAVKEALLDQAEDFAKLEVKKLKEEMQKSYESKKYDLTHEQYELSKTTSEDIQKVFSLYKEKGENISDFLINRITSVDIKLARNVVGDFSSLQNMA